MAKKASKKAAKKTKKKAGKKGFVATMLERAKARYGDHIYAAGEHRDRFFGLPLPGLAIRYVMDSNIMPLGKLIGIAGPPKSNKSTFGLELLKLVAAAEGMGVLVETEGGKIGPQLLEEMLSDFAYDQSIQLAPVESAEEGQEHLTTLVSDFMEAAPEKDELLGIVLDSLTGAAKQETSEKIEEFGFHDRGFEGAVRAQMFSHTFSHLAPRLDGWPCLLAFVNHVKEKIETGPHGHKQKYSPGGVSQEYHTCLNVLFERAGKGKDLVTNDRTVRPLKISVNRSSFGTDNRQILANFVAYQDENHVRHIQLDWGDATVQLLKRFMAPSLKHPMRDLIQIDPIGNTGRWKCDQLGVKTATSTELGDIINADPQLMADTQALLGVQQYRVWKGATDITEGVTTSLAKRDVEDLQAAGAVDPLEDLD
jgi:RecA/RadA recombinase